MTAADDAHDHPVSDATVELPPPVAYAPQPSLRARPGAGRLRHRADRTTPRRPSADAAVALTLTTVTLVFLAWNITGFPSASDDEGTYLAQAWAVRHGLGLTHYTYWYDHPPLGWLQLAGLSWIPAALMPDALTVAGGRLAMIPVAGCSLLLVYVFCRRLGFARWTAGLALLGYGLSPISLTLLRQIYLDNFAVMWMLAAFVLALSARKHLWHHLAAGLAVAVALLCKETVAVVAPAVAVALWQHTAHTSVRPRAFGAFISSLVLAGSVYPLYAAAKGQLIPGTGHVSLIGAWQFQLRDRPGSGSIFTPGTGSNLLLHAWMHDDSVLLVGGFTATVVAVGMRRLRAPAIAAGLLVLVALRPGGYLPGMYVIQALPFFAIVLAGAVEIGVAWALTAPLRRVRWLRWSVLVVTALIAATYVLPRWYAGDRRALTTDDNAGYRAAATWLRADAPDRGDTVVVDDVLWLDLVNAGYRRDRVIWFYKLDLDPQVAARLAHGWRDVDYLVSTPAVRQGSNALPTIATLLRNSAVVSTFGVGDDRIEIRRVNR
jgi:4-amino-4-deoxy-L-arabinose transferase-like glycosyltransferase